MLQNAPLGGRIAAAVVSGTLALASPASADPTPAGPSASSSASAPDTTQDVTNALAGGHRQRHQRYSTTAVKSANGAGIASYDAIEPGTGATGTEDHHPHRRHDLPAPERLRCRPHRPEPVADRRPGLLRCLGQGPGGLRPLLRRSVQLRHGAHVHPDGA
ncbi:hypothetical protein ACRAWF_20565 [Streptomyces sp. L7]